MTTPGSDDETPQPLVRRRTKDEDPPLRSDLKAALEALYVPRAITDDNLQVFRARFDAARRERELDRLARLGAPRDPSTYNYSKGEDRRVRFYETRYDRLANLVLGLGGFLIGAAAFIAPSLVKGGDRDRLLACTVALSGGCLAAVGVQSGRTGYLQKKSINHIDDIGASLSTTIIRGHHQVHEAEAELLRCARDEGSRRVLLIDLWHRERRSTQTAEFDKVQHEARRYVEESDGDLLTAVAATKPNLDQCALLMRDRLGKAKQIFYFQNPVQVDGILSEDEAILSFPRKGTDRDFALHFRSPAIVRELWDIFEGQLLERSDIDAIAVRDESDIERIQQRVTDAGYPEYVPQGWS